VKAKKLKRLQAAGWKSGSASKFLGLSEPELTFVEFKLALVDAVRNTRQRQ
jgi:hypothetical protein